MNPKSTERPAPTQEYRTNFPAIPYWNAGNDNQDPHQDPSRVIPFLMGV